MNDTKSDTISLWALVAIALIVAVASLAMPAGAADYTITKDLLSGSVNTPWVRAGTIDINKSNNIRCLNYPTITIRSIYDSTTSQPRGAPDTLTGRYVTMAGMCSGGSMRMYNVIGVHGCSASAAGPAGPISLAGYVSYVTGSMTPTDSVKWYFNSTPPGEAGSWVYLLPVFYMSTDQVLKYVRDVLRPSASSTSGNVISIAWSCGIVNGNAQIDIGKIYMNHVRVTGLGIPTSVDMGKISNGTGSHLESRVPVRVTTSDPLVPTLEGNNDVSLSASYDGNMLSVSVEQGGTIVKLPSDGKSGADISIGGQSGIVLIFSTTSGVSGARPGNYSIPVQITATYP